MSKKWFLLIPLILICFLIFDNIIIYKVVEWSLRRTFHNEFQGELKWASIEQHGAEIRLKGVEVVKPGQEATFKAEALNLQWKMSFLKRVISLDLELVSPHVHLVDCQLDFLRPREAVAYGLFETEGLLKIIDGKFYLPCGVLEADAVIHSGQDKKLEVSLKQKTSHLDLYLHKKDGENELTFKASDFSLPILSELIEGLASSSNLGQVRTGVLNGHLSYKETPENRPQIQGNLNLNNLYFASPSSEILLKAPELKILLKEAVSKKKDPLYPWLPSLLGEIRLTSDSSLKLDVLEGRPFYAKELKGRLLFEEGFKIFGNLSGEEEYEGYFAPFQFKGSFDYETIEHSILALSYTSENKDKTPLTIEVKGFDLGEKKSQLLLDLKNVGSQQFTLLEAALRELAPGLNPIDFKQGRVTAKVKASLIDRQIGVLAVNEISLKEVKSHLNEWECDCGAEGITGHFKLNLQAEHPFDTLDSELTIVNGFVKLNYLESKIWTFNDIQTKLVVENGIVQNSVASVNLMGLRGQAELSWQSKERPLAMHFSGKGKDLALFLPQKIQEGLKKESLNDEITLDVAMKKELGTLRFRGSAKVQDVVKGTRQPFEFGFDLIPPTSNYSANDKDETFWLDINQKWLPELFGPYNHASGQAMMAERQKERGLLGFRLANGWLSGKSVDLSKFVSPYMFAKGQMQLKGIADLSIMFDLSGIELLYSAQSISIENEKVRMSMDETLGTIKEAKAKDDSIGHHWLDFKTGRHVGVLPLSKASYYDKTKGILFDDIEGEVLFRDKKIFLKNLTGISEGLDLTGDVLVDMSDPKEGFFDILIHMNSLAGDLKGVSAFLGKIDENLLLSHLPLTGQVQLLKEGAEIVFKLQPKEFEWDAKIAGTLADGQLDFSDDQVVSKAINLNFNYHRSADQLIFSDISGALIIGDNKNLEPLHFFADRLGFDRLTTREGAFNVKIWDAKGEALSIKGSTTGDEDKIAFHFNPDESHFFGIYPTFIDLELLSSGQIGRLALDFNGDLSRLPLEIKRLFSSQETSPTVLKKIHALNGDVAVKLRFDDHERVLNYELIGKDVAYQDKKYKEAYLRGIRTEGIWKVKEGVLDDLSFSFDLTKRKSSWLIEHLGLKVGESLIAGLEGEWEEGSTEFKARVHLLEIALENLHEFDELKPFTEEFNPKGTLKGSGMITFSENKEGGLGVEASLTTYFKEMELKGLSFQDLEPSSLQFVLGHGLQFRNMKSALVDPVTKKPVVDLFIEKINIDIDSDQIDVDNLVYSLPSSDLHWLSHQLEKTFPDLVTPFVQDCLKGLKIEGPVEGSLGFNFRGDETIARATLADGQWNFFGWDAKVNNFSLELNNEEVKVATQYLLDQEKVWLLARSPRPDFESGIIVVSDSKEEPMSDGPPRPFPEPIKIYWEKRGAAGVAIKKIHGSALGLHLDLDENTESPSDAEWLSLKGEAAIDLSQASALCPPELRNKITMLGIGRGWGLRGDFHVQKEAKIPKGKDFERAFHYEGEIHGENFDFKGYRLDRLYGTLVANEKVAWFKDLSIEDQGGKLIIDQAVFEKGPLDIWSVQVPSIKGIDIRPSLIKESSKSGSKTSQKPLLIRNFYLTNLQGSLTPLSSLTGEGYFNFVNPKKKNLQNTIFAIPGEILSRIGIDLVALSPVTGTLHFEIEDEKVVFTKFKDMYSEGKLSKFYLADGKSSYMDFDGNLHLQVKMKQYTLLFKLAELFTFNIEGSISKPSYSLRKGS